MTDLFTMNGEQMVWFVEKKYNLEGLSFRRNDIFMVHLSHTASDDTDISHMAFDGVSVGRFKGKIFLSDSKKIIVFHLEKSSRHYTLIFEQKILKNRILLELKIIVSCLFLFIVIVKIYCISNTSMCL